MSEQVTPAAASATVTPAAVVDSTPTTPAAAPATTNPGIWTDGLNDDLKGYVGVKGFKDPAAVIDSYRNLEKLVGVPADRLLKFPEKKDDPTWGEIYKRLGKPEKVDGYKIPMPKEGGDAAFAKVAAEVFHKANLSQEQAETLSTWWNGMAEGQTKAAAAAQQTEIAQQTNALKQEWGAAFEQNVRAMDTVIDKLGMSEEQLVGLKNSMGAAGAAKFLYGISSKIGEHAFESGSAGANGVYSPASAKAAIDMKVNDADFRARLLNKDVAAKQEWEQLHRNLVGER